MTEERFRTGKGIFEDGYPSETIIDNETGKKYYKGYAYSNSSKEICKLLNKFVDENKQLQQQNDRQAKQLDNLYRLIEEKYWRTLSDILDDFKKAEEQLQRESRTYGDFRMTDKGVTSADEITIDLTKLDLDFSKNLIQKRELMEWILSKMIYYEKIIDNTDGYDNVSAKGHLDMLIKLKEFVEEL